MPVAIVRLAWGSRSTTRMDRPRSASAAATLSVLVVLAVPPFWLKNPMMRGMADGLPEMYVRRGGRIPPRAVA